VEDRKDVKSLKRRFEQLENSAVEDRKDVKSLKRRLSPAVEDLQRRVEQLENARAGGWV